MQSEPNCASKAKRKANQAYNVAERGYTADYDFPRILVIRMMMMMMRMKGRKMSFKIDENEIC